MYATNYFEQMVLNTMRGQAAAAPAALYLALYLSNPGETGSEGTEVNYAGYARQAVAFTAPAAMNGGIGVQNTADITFPVSGVNMGTVTHVGVLDSPSGGNMLLYGEFIDGLIVEANESPVIVAGEAQWWMTGEMSRAFRTKVLGLLRGQSISGFAPYLALYNGNPEDGGAELSGGNYARLQLTFAAPEVVGNGQSEMANSVAVSTQRATAAWGTWTHTAVFDWGSGGVPVYFEPRTAPKEVRQGMRVYLDVGALKLSMH